MTKEQAERMKMLRQELGKVRYWLTGYEAGAGKSVPRVDALRQTQLLFDELLKPHTTAAKRRV